MEGRCVHDSTRIRPIVAVRKEDLILIRSTWKSAEPMHSAAKLAPKNIVPTYLPSRER